MLDDSLTLEEREFEHRRAFYAFFLWWFLSFGVLWVSGSKP